ncbi:MAG TPA: TonB-dependent receptor [Vicinamibacterales bacterium]|nr:TonB-dependent receptor [Vicinamibacterales bacterium]
MPITERRVATLAVTAVVSLLLTGTLRAQPAPREGTLRVVVADPSGAVIVGARVTLVALDPAGLPAEAATGNRGEAEFTSLRPGRYAVRAEFAGFEPQQLDDIRVRPGAAVRRDVRLPIARIAHEVDVGQDPQDRALDSRGNAFSNVLTREQIDALPDDPDEMQEVLEQMGGPGATVRVDGFRGGRLPPKSQIQAIRFRRDLFAAENHGGGMIFVDVLTRPGGGPLRGTVDLTFRDDSLSARNPFAPRRSPEQQQNVTFSLNGTLVKDRTGFSFTTNGLDAYDSKTILAAVPAGTVNTVVRRPTDRISFSARLDHALTRSHTLRGSYQRNASVNENLGVGNFDLLARAYTRDASEDLFRVSLSGPLARSFFAETRVQARRQSIESTSRTDSPAVLVLDAFNSGGAQVAGGRDSSDIEVAADVDYTKGRHSARAGLLLETGRYRSNDVRNATGTFTFASLAEYEAARPTTFTRRIGNALVEYRHTQFGWYVQDDIRLARSVALSLGLRHELQSHIDDRANLAPRLGGTWSPRKSGTTTLRGGAGVFYDWYEAQVYEQTLRVDGVRQADLVVQSPGYPDPLLGGTAVPLPPGRLVQSPDLSLPTILRTNLGVEQMIGRSARTNVMYFYSSGSQLFRGRNLNAPFADGSRPDPSSGNMTQVESTARSQGHMVHAGFNMNLPWHRTFLFLNYTFARMRNDTDGPFALPADNYDPRAEWGPSALDIPHRVTGMLNMDLWRGFKVATNFFASSGTPYTITTGHDDNGDTVSNDRPAGVGRNAARTTARAELGMRLSWAFGFGRRPGADSAGGPQVVMIRAGGGGETPMGGFSGGADDRRWRFEVYVAATNLLNRTNLLGFSGVMSSPFFRQPTSAAPARRIELGARFGF